MSEELKHQKMVVSFDPDTERMDEINESLRLIQKKNGLTFGTDAYMLSAFVKEKNGGKKKIKAVELGGGTGVASLLLLSKGKVESVYVYEIQEEFCHLITRNADLNGFSESFFVINKDVREAHSTDTDGECDVVISNPPYMKTDSGARNEYDEKYIARHEVYGNISDFADAAKKLLRHGGSFYCVYRPDRLVDLIVALRQCGLEPKVATFVYADGESEPSMVLVESRKGGRPSLKITKPLIIYKDTCGDSSKGAREMTDAAKRIYDTCSFSELV